MCSRVCPSLTRIFPDAVDSRCFSATLHRSCPVAFRRTFVSFPIVSPPKSRLLIHSRSHSSDSHVYEEGEDSETIVQDLRIPDEWLFPSRAMEESEWLRLSLQKWLDDEYCPEPTNVEISSIAAKSLYKSLMARQTDLGVILLKMAKDLEAISYQESFHGAFSSANAAVNLIIEKIEIP